MSGISAQRVRVLRLLGRMPSVAKIEARRSSLRREFERYQKIVASDPYHRFLELKQFAESTEPQRIEAQCANENFVGSKEANELAEFKALKKDPNVKKAIKGKGEKGAQVYKRFLELQAKVTSQEFIDRVAYLKDKKRYKRTQAYANLQELKRLEKARDIKWVLHHQARGTFDLLLREREVFFDDFTTEEPNPKKWLTRFFWGDALAKHAYSFIGDPHCFTDGDNISVENSALTIETKPEERGSLAWDRVLGFVTEYYKYTTGVLCTGHSFRMNRGRLDIKMRIKNTPGVYHSLYLVGDTRAPQIDVFRTTTTKKVGLMSGVTRNEVNSLSLADGVGALPSGEDYFLLTFDWADDTMKWSINETPYLTLENVKGFDSPMYLVLLSGVEADATPTDRAQMSIDWIRCTTYEK